jgi:hypothetical protein
MSATDETFSERAFLKNNSMSELKGRKVSYRRKVDLYLAIVLLP